ncbi:MAG: hypothetical protein ACOY3I_01715 [Verrucomicrobiota bacterium]
MSDAHHWKRTIPESQMRSRFWMSLILGWILGMFCFIAMLGWQEKRPAETLPDFLNAKAIFVVASTPSKELLERLNAAHQNGIRVQLVTEENMTADYRVSTVPSGKIIRDAILLDGTAWYPLP